VQLLHDLSARRQASQGKQAIARRKAKELEAQRAAGKAHQQQMLSNTAVTADGAKTIARHNLRHGAAQSTHEEVTGVPLGQVGAAAAVTISTESDTDDSIVPFVAQLLLRRELRAAEAGEQHVVQRVGWIPIEVVANTRSLHRCTQLRQQVGLCQYSAVVLVPGVGTVQAGD
jgi:hypothetical protein